MKRHTTIMILVVIAVAAVLIFSFVSSITTGVGVGEFVSMHVPSIVSGIFVASLFWYIFERKENGRREYVRERVAEACSECHTIVMGMVEKPDVSDGDGLDRVVRTYTKAIRLLEIHAYMMPPDEIEDFKDVWEVIESEVVRPLQEGTGDVSDLQLLAECLGEQLWDYIKEHRIGGHE